MPHINHDFNMNETTGATVTVLLTVFSFTLDINIYELDAVALFVTHVLQGAAATIACVVGFFTFKSHIQNGKKTNS